MIATRRVRVERWTPSSRIGAGTVVVIVLGLATLPFWAPSDVMWLIVEFACLLAMAQMWNLLAGYGGLISIGQQAYIGIGAYGLVVLANDAHVNPFVCVLLGGVAAALFAIPTSRIVFRLSGGYFAVGTWVVAEVYRLAFTNSAALGGGSGQSLTALIGIPRDVREAVTFWLAIALVVATTGGVYWLLQSRLGLALTAIRDSSVAAASQGVDVAGRSARRGFRCSSSTVVIGGIGTIEGPILGTLIYFALRQTLGDFGSWYLIILGCAAIGVMLWAPRGIWGAASERFGWRMFPIARMLKEPTHHS